MCGAPAAAAIIAVASTAFSAHQDIRNRKRQEGFRRRKAEQERITALAEQRISSEEILTQQIADQNAANEEIETNRRKATAAVATATTVAGEIGAFGLSYQALLSDFAQQQAKFETGVETNIATRNAFTRLNLEAAALQKDVRFLNANTLPTTRPNYANYAISGLSTYFSLSSNKGFNKMFA